MYNMLCVFAIPVSRLSDDCAVFYVVNSRVVELTGMCLTHFRSAICVNILLLYLVFATYTGNNEPDSAEVLKILVRSCSVTI